jgi:hypothetical protein
VGTAHVIFTLTLVPSCFVALTVNVASSQKTRRLSPPPRRYSVTSDMQISDQLRYLSAKAAARISICTHEAQEVLVPAYGVPWIKGY